MVIIDQFAVNVGPVPVPISLESVEGVVIELIAWNGKTNNTDTVYMGNKKVTVGTGFPLAPKGAYYNPPFPNKHGLKIDASTVYLVSEAPQKLRALVLG